MLVTAIRPLSLCAKGHGLSILRGLLYCLLPNQYEAKAREQPIANSRAASRHSSRIYILRRHLMSTIHSDWRNDQLIRHWNVRPITTSASKYRPVWEDNVRPVNLSLHIAAAVSFCRKHLLDIRKRPLSQSSFSLELILLLLDGAVLWLALLTNVRAIWQEYREHPEEQASLADRFRATYEAFEEPPFVTTLRR